MKSETFYEMLSVALVIIGLSAWLMESRNGPPLNMNWALMIAFGGTAMRVWLTRQRQARRRLRRVFIHTAQTDPAKATQMAQWLRECGFNPWLDTTDAQSGQVASLSIDKALDESGAALFLLSPGSDGNDGDLTATLTRVLTRMHDLDKTRTAIIPVLLDEVAIPRELADYQPIPAYTELGRRQLEKRLEYLFGAT